MLSDCQICLLLRLQDLHRVAVAWVGWPCWQVSPILSLQGLPQTIRWGRWRFDDEVPRPCFFFSSALRRLALRRPCAFVHLPLPGVGAGLLSPLVTPSPWEVVRGKGIGDGISGTIIKSSPDSSESDSPEGRPSGFDEPYHDSLWKIVKLPDRFLRLFFWESLMQASLTLPGGLESRLPFLATTRFPTFCSSAQLPLEKLNLEETGALFGQYCSVSVSSSLPPPSPFWLHGMSKSQTGGIRKQAGLFRAPKPRRQGPWCPCGVSSWPGSPGLMRQLCLSLPLLAPEATGAALQ